MNVTQARNKNDGDTLIQCLTFQVIISSHGSSTTFLLQIQHIRFHYLTHPQLSFSVIFNINKMYGSSMEAWWGEDMGMIKSKR